MRGNTAMIMAVLGVSAAVAGGPALAGGEATGASTSGDPVGFVEAAGLLVTYSDRETFFPSSTTEPPTTTSPHALSGFENTGTGFAQAALAYNPYEEAPAAINGVAPPGSPEVPAGELRARAQAGVRGAAPQSKDSSVGPSGAAVRPGNVSAALEEAGPAAVAQAAFASGAPGPGIEIGSAVSQARMSKADGKATGSAVTILKDVNLNDVLHFDSITVTADSLADGGPGAAKAAVTVVGGAVNGTPVQLTDKGLVVNGSPSPLASDAVTDALAQAGIELLVAGGSSSKPGGAVATAAAKGPTFQMKTDAGQVLRVNLGVVTSDVELFSAGTGSESTADETGNELGAAPTGPGAAPSALPARLEEA